MGEPLGNTRRIYSDTYSIGKRSPLKNNKNSKSQVNCHPKNVSVYKRTIRQIVLSTSVSLGQTHKRMNDGFPADNSIEVHEMVQQNGNKTKNLYWKLPLYH